MRGLRGLVLRVRMVGSVWELDVRLLFRDIAYSSTSGCGVVLFLVTGSISVQNAVM